ncbi:hypothetical protein DFH09DRAFT_1097070 [Mycena vulgaris]|nr:hypothetical protein DFH09DRAFT_1097070 [Mycena vulgaris]
MAIHEPAEASSWMEDNWDNNLLTSIQDNGCGGPFAWMLSPEEPALAIFGCYENPTVVNMAQSLADLSGFPVVIRLSDNNPGLTLLTHDTHGSVQCNGTTDNDNGRRSDRDEANENGSSTRNSGNNGRRADEIDPAGSDEHGLNTADEQKPNRGNGGPPGGGGPSGSGKPQGGGGPPGGGAQGGGDGGRGGGGAGPTAMDGKWESPLHRTRVKLRIKLNTAQTYAITIGYTFKVECICDCIII